MPEAVGIHHHPERALGRRPPKRAPSLKLKAILTGVPVAHPPTADHFAKLPFGLYQNDRFGVCGPCSAANLVRLVTGGLLGVEVEPSQDDVFDLYRRSGNPDFNPATGAGDRGVDMQTMLEALLHGGIGDGKGGNVKPIAFAQVDVADDVELDAAVSIFGGVLWGVTLQIAQQKQTDLPIPMWDYKAGSRDWGGHAVMHGKYAEGPTIDDEVISWMLDIHTTAAFRRQCLEEAWVVIWPWNIDHPHFQAGIDLTLLAAAYKSLTGRDLPIPVEPIPTPPQPAPAPTHADEFDLGLYQQLAPWAAARHVGTNAAAAKAFLLWAKAKGLSS